MDGDRSSHCLLVLSPLLLSASSTIIFNLPLIDLSTRFGTAPDSRIKFPFSIVEHNRQRAAHA